MGHKGQTKNKHGNTRIYEKESSKMKQRKIKISSISEAKDFVSKAVNCAFDINIFYNRVIIDAKSILGVLSMDLRQVLTVEYDGEDKEFEEFLDEHDAAKVHAVA